MWLTVSFENDCRQNVKDSELFIVFKNEDIIRTTVDNWKIHHLLHIKYYADCLDAVFLGNHMDFDTRPLIIAPVL